VTLTLWQFLHSKLQQHIPCALLTVLDCQGSTPAKTGSSMIISADNECYGTIGGGTIEYKLTKEVRRTLNNSSPKVQHTRIISHEIGMLCGGQQDIATCLLTTVDLPFIEQIISQLRQNRSITLSLSPKGLAIDYPYEFPYNFQNNEQWLFQKILGTEPRIFIIGGGHVSLALSQVLKFLEFHITIFDTRPHLTLLDNNPYANVKITLKHYQELKTHITDSPQNYAIIMTHSHRTDEIALAQLYNKKLAYLGLMGSQRKIDILFSHLYQQGVKPEQLKHLHAPIGLHIGSQTPQEIAISIASELIIQKNKT